jgi:hypothetical protein
MSPKGGRSSPAGLASAVAKPAKNRDAAAMRKSAKADRKIIRITHLQYKVYKVL